MLNDVMDRIGNKRTDRKLGLWRGAGNCDRFVTLWAKGSWISTWRA